MNTSSLNHPTQTNVYSQSKLTIDTQKIERNIEIIREKLPPDNRIMAIVKASAYGTNMIGMTRALSSMGIDIFGVAHLEEAITLRRAGVEQDIFVIYVPEYHLHEIPKWNLQLAICERSSVEQLQKIAETERTKIKVHLHVNTGMSRFGCHPGEALDLACAIHSAPWLEFEGIMSHFHSSDIPEKDLSTYRQINTFDAVIESIEECGITIPWKHIANSSAVCRFHLPQYNMVRTGIGLYGVHLADCCAQALPLELALKLTTKIVDIKRCIRGQTVSYEASYTVNSDLEIIGALGIGYHDGLHRSYGNRSYCCVNGFPAPYVGNICMDFALINLTSVPVAQVGDEVTIFGEDSSGSTQYPHYLTSSAETNSHELLACIGPRVHREFLWKVRG